MLVDVTFVTAQEFSENEEAQKLHTEYMDKYGPEKLMTGVYHSVSSNHGSFVKEKLNTDVEFDPYIIVHFKRRDNYRLSELPNPLMVKHCHKKPYKYDDNNRRVYLNNYGVCDSPEQLLEFYDFEKDARKLVIFMYCLQKKYEQENGWRWHKNGVYIGNQQPQAEYLFDEPVIERIWSFHICQVGE